MPSPTYPRGFTPIPRDAYQLTPKYKENVPAIPWPQLKATIPSTPLVDKVIAHLRPQLGEQIWNHSHRAYLMSVAMAIVQFPEWVWDPESYYIALLFHDLGASPENLKVTKLSFEYWSAIQARNFLLPDEASATQDEKDLADGVCEACIRHSISIHTPGNISTHGQMIQLGTTLDVVGGDVEPTFIARETVDDIVKAYPRLDWGGCFGHAMKTEIETKPWSLTASRSGDTAEKRIKANSYMLHYEVEEEGGK